MLGLLVPTDPSWLDAARGQLDRLLSDHAHCELKAAHSALSLVGRFGGEAPEIVAPLLALAKEETGHFDQVHRRIEDRGGTLAIPASDGYVVALRRAAREDHQAHPVLLDRLLICALIEGRSCERFALLADGLDSAELRGFYGGLMESEARHYRLFCRLAEDRFGFEAARARLSTLAAREAEVVHHLPLGPTVHG
ncbi:MAG: tRNA-(ms[2]io[6]A)-hydroxylase [Sandaracinaceae bacterium]|nr:tRNA-(ms[2]io[6]A)-hydroxylase [Sandaracinaceae bacterium]